MTPEEFQVWRKQLTRTIRTKLEQCPDEGCDCILWTGALDSSGYASAKFRRNQKANAKAEKAEK